MSVFQLPLFQMGVAGGRLRIAQFGNISYGLEGRRATFSHHETHCVRFGNVRHGEMEAFTKSTFILLLRKHRQFSCRWLLLQLSIVIIIITIAATIIIIVVVIDVLLLLLLLKHLWFNIIF